MKSWFGVVAEIRKYNHSTSQHLFLRPVVVVEKLFCFGDPDETRPVKLSGAESQPVADSPTQWGPTRDHLQEFQSRARVHTTYYGCGSRMTNIYPENFRLQTAATQCSGWPHTIHAAGCWSRQHRTSNILSASYTEDSDASDRPSQTGPRAQRRA